VKTDVRCVLSLRGDVLQAALKEQRASEEALQSELASAREQV